MKFLFFAGGATVTGMEVALLSLMARLNAIGHRTVAIVSGWHDGAYLPMLDAAGIEHHEVFLGRIYRNNPNWTRGTLYARCARPRATYAPSPRRCDPTGWCSARHNRCCSAR